MLTSQARGGHPVAGTWDHVRYLAYTKKKTSNRVQIAKYILNDNTMVMLLKGEKPTFKNNLKI
jgi:hypothetical protein